MTTIGVCALRPFFFAMVILWGCMTVGAKKYRVFTRFLESFCSKGLPFALNVDMLFVWDMHRSTAGL